MNEKFEVPKPIDVEPIEEEVNEPNLPFVSEGIKEIIDVLKAYKSGKILFDAVMADGKIGVNDVVHIVKGKDFLQDLLKAYEGYERIPSELEYADIGDTEELITLLGSAFNVNTDKAKAILTNGMKAAYYTKLCIQSF